MADELYEEIRKLEHEIGHLAASWRGSFGKPHQQDILNQYHQTIAKLFELGWDDYLDAESELPTRVMPEEYKRRKPTVGDWK